MCVCSVQLRYGESADINCLVFKAHWKNVQKFDEASRDFIDLGNF